MNTLVLIFSINLALMVALMAHARPSQENSPRGSAFVDIQKINPSILVEARYFSEWNFVGTKIDGYNANLCLLTEQAAHALSMVQKEVRSKGFSLLVFDCYRPQKAVDHFARWSQDFTDTKMKSVFYPAEKKQTLFKHGYIASKSGHSRGSTVDLTLVHLSETKKDSFQENLKDCRKTTGIAKTTQLNMGTSFDCFSDLSSTDHPQTSKEAAKNRSLLKSSMEKFGFKNYSKEWWHYTLTNEPHPDDYFDFDVE